MKTKLYYTYIYSLPNGQPLYVGKGSGRRAESHNTTNRPKSHIQVALYALRHAGVQVVLTKIEAQSEEGAFALERQLIAKYGRLDKKTGVLINRTDGGDGCRNYEITEETRARISASHRGKKKSAETRANMSAAQRGRFRTAEHAAKLAAANTGKVTPDEVKAKIAASVKATLAKKRST